MQEIVICGRHSGFWISEEGRKRIQELKGEETPEPPYYSDINRDDPHLIQTIKELGIEAGEDLKIVEVPDGVEWEVEEYDGLEWVSEAHRTWS